MVSLDQALHILAAIHTADDDRTGFHVSMFPIDNPGSNYADYVEAWKAVRQHLHLRVERREMPVNAGVRRISD